MKLKNFAQIEAAALSSRGEFIRLGVALLFIAGIILFAGSELDGGYMLVVAAIMGGYMALNIGANDVANNVGPAVGSRALTMAGAILIAAIFEASGSLIAGGDVVSTIKKGIIDPQLIQDTNTFVWLMMGALLAAAIWLNIATYLGAPVSTTHSIVGGVLGAGIAAGGPDIANWGKMGAIVASWVISPVLGGIIAAGFLYLIKHSVTYRKDMLAAARRVVPLLVAAMAWAFSTYLILKGLKHIWKFDFPTATLIGLAVAVVIYLLVRIPIGRATASMDNNKPSINRLFTIPLIFAAALLSFAHGANDVANAVGPLAAVSEALSHGGIASKAPIPLWVMMIGALGIALGLALYGPKLIRTVGSEITELDQSRAFCIAMAAAITVIIASQLGLPVSSTHIAVGGVFGVGFLREHIKASYARMVSDIETHHRGADRQVVEEFMERFRSAPLDEKRDLVQNLKDRSVAPSLSKSERRHLNKMVRQQLVKRSALMKIVAAWVVTVPASGLMAAFLYYTLRGVMLP